MDTQRKQHQFKLGETQYAIQEFDPDEALYWMARMMHIFAGGLHGIGVTPAGQIERTPINFGSIIRGVIDRVPPNELPELLRMVVAQSLVLPDYRDEMFTELFRGKTSELLELVYKIFETNYATISESQKKTITNIIGPFFASFAPAAQADNNEQ